MSKITFQSNTVTALKTHRVMTETLRVDIGHLNVIVGEQLFTLWYDEEITIPVGVPYAISNFSPSAATVSVTIEQQTFADDTLLIADTRGHVHIANPSPSMQATLSLYMGMLDMQMPSDSREAA